MAEPSEQPKKEAPTNIINYQGNAKKAKEPPGTPEKKVEKIVSGEVVIQKKGIGRKAKEAVVAADFKSVGGYLIWDVLIPAVKNVIVDTATKGIERAIYGERAVRTRNNAVGRGRGESRVTLFPYDQQRDPISARAVDVSSRRGIEQRSSDRETYILSTREDADRVLDELTETIEAQGYVTVATLKELIGFPSTHVDYKWGWTHLIGVQSKQVREGYIIDFPHPTQV
jgi:hypothetical protein